MSRSLVAGTVLLASAIASCSPGPRALPEGRRHVLLLTVDTLRADFLSGAGYPLPTSPFLDELAAASARFPLAVTPVARTTPAFAAMLTGHYPHANRVRSLHHPLPDVVPYVPDLARRRGYRTIAVLSNPILAPERRLDRGFEVYDVSPEGRSGDATTQAALSRVRAIDPGEAVLLWVLYLEPHIPYLPPAELARAFDPGYRGPYELAFGGDPSAIDGAAYPEELGKEGAVFRNRLGAEVNEHVRRLYAAEIRSADDEIRRLVTALEEHTGSEWLIVFTSDHGESLGENDYYYDHGAYVSEGELRVPLFFRFAAGDPLRGSIEVRQWVSLVDVAPTLIDLLDLDESATGRTAGRSLAAAIAGRPLAPRPVFGESGTAFSPELIDGRFDFTPAGRLRTVYHGRQKLVWTPGAPPDLEYRLEELAAGAEGAGEASEAQLRRLLQAWSRSSPPPPETPPSEEDLRRLRSLGYVD